MVDDQRSSVEVPEGFRVNVYGIAQQPGVAVLPAGLVLANFGCGSDDPAELLQIVAQAEQAARRSAEARPLFATDVERLEDLLGEEKPATAPARCTIVWACCGDGLRVLLDGGQREAELVAMLTRLPSLGLVIDTGWMAGSGCFEALRSARVVVWQVRPGSPFLIEVTRPDDARVHALTGPDAPDGPPTPRIGPVWSSPRLRRVMLEAATTGSHAGLHHALVDRSIPLVFIVGPDGMPVLHSTPEAPLPTLPVFADLVSLHHAARLLELHDEQYEVGALMFANLMQLAHTQHSTVALGVFDDAGVATYIPFSTK